MPPQVLNIPPHPPACEGRGVLVPRPDNPCQQYTVLPGDTLSAIASGFGASTADLAAANPQVADPDLLFPGMVLRVPPFDPTCDWATTPGTAGQPGGYAYGRAARPLLPYYYSGAYYSGAAAAVPAYNGLRR